jgi:hypothetical protein
LYAVLSNQENSMKNGIIILITVFLASCGGVRAKSTTAEGATLYAPNNGEICLMAGAPASDIQYEIVGRVVATKRTYGSSDELFMPMALEARKLGADAIINLQASQRFKGPMPWRVTSPTGDGQAIKVLPGSPKIQCLLAGGRLLGPDGMISNATSTAMASGAGPQPGDSGAEVAVLSNHTAAELDVYEELIKLGELREKGLLTDEEFNTEKKELLQKN